MTTPLPPHLAVRFDHGVAALLAAQLDELAVSLDAVVDREAEAAAVATVHWAGTSRRWFDDGRHQLRDQLRTAARRARDDAEVVRRAALAAADLEERRTLEHRLAAERDRARLADLARRAPVGG